MPEAGVSICETLLDYLDRLAPVAREARVCFSLVGMRSSVPTQAMNTCSKLRALAGAYSITSSVRNNKDVGTSRRSALAALRLITSSTFVTCCTGRSAGFSPLRIRPA